MEDLKRPKNHQQKSMNTYHEKIYISSVNCKYTASATCNEFWIGKSVPKKPIFLLSKKSLATT